MRKSYPLYKPAGRPIKTTIGPKRTEMTGTSSQPTNEFCVQTGPAYPETRSTKKQPPWITSTEKLLHIHYKVPWVDQIQGPCGTKNNHTALEAYEQERGQKSTLRHWSLRLWPDFHLGNYEQDCSKNSCSRTKKSQTFPRGELKFN